MKWKKQNTVYIGLATIAVITLIIFLAITNQGESNRTEEVTVEKVDHDPIEYEDVDKPDCQPEKKFILEQLKRVETAITDLKKNYNNLSIQNFERYLSQWNRDIEVIRDDINNHKYVCFKYVGIKAFGTLAMQLGLGYIHIVMYNDDSDVRQLTPRIKEKKKYILASLETEEWKITQIIWAPIKKLAFSIKKVHYTAERMY